MGGLTIISTTTGLRSCSSSNLHVSGGCRLLIHDGHGSHDTMHLIKLTQEHKIILFCLPPLTTHKLQPPDVGVFRPFQSVWIDCCHKVVEETCKEIPKEDFIQEYMVIRAKTFKPSNTKSAWKSSGTWLINSDIFSDKDYAPSIPFSTETINLPASFPINTFQSINMIHSTLMPK
jgi:hypothetical protein